MSPILVEDILEDYNEYIRDFDANQKTKWTRWHAILPERLAKVKSEHLASGGRVKFWQDLNYFFMIMSAAIPVIIGILVTFLILAPVASLLDAIFPAIVVVAQKKLSYWSERRHVFAQVVSPYSTLLSDVVIDIYENKYSDERHVLYQKEWKDLDEVIREHL